MTPWYERGFQTRACSWLNSDTISAVCTGNDFSQQQCNVMFGFCGITYSTRLMKTVLAFVKWKKKTEQPHLCQNLSGESALLIGFLHIHKCTRADTHFLECSQRSILTFNKQATLKYCTKKHMAKTWWGSPIGCPSYCFAHAPQTSRVRHFHTDISENDSTCS